MRGGDVQYKEIGDQELNMRWNLRTRKKKIWETWKVSLINEYPNTSSSSTADEILRLKPSIRVRNKSKYYNKVKYEISSNWNEIFKP